MFINELKMYVDHLKKEIQDFSGTLTNAQIKKWKNFKDNLLQGIGYYENLFRKTDFFSTDSRALQQLEQSRLIISEIEIPQ
jgi:hypothetical protein